MNDDTPGRHSFRHKQAASWANPGESCPRCGVRADVDCPHRPGSGKRPATVEEVGKPPVKDRRSAQPAVGGGGHYRQFPGLNGLNFKRKRD